MFNQVNSKIAQAVSVGHYSHIIIGAGSAGCLLANRLVKSSQRNRVLILESGPQDNYMWIHIPVGYLYCIGNPRTDWLFSTVKETGLNGRSLLYPRGRVLGGCSSINGMLYVRGQSHDYDSWAAETEDEKWSWNYTLPRFKSFEQYYGEENDWHGKTGEWIVTKQRLHYA